MHRVMLQKKKKKCQQNYQISFQNKLIIHKRNARFLKCTITKFDKIHIVNWKSKVEEDNNLWIKKYHIHLVTLFISKFSFHSHICKFLKLVNFFSKSQVNHKRKSFTCKVSFKIWFNNWLSSHDGMMEYKSINLRTNLRTDAKN
jgi:hypothetical protein